MAPSSQQEGGGAASPVDAELQILVKTQNGKTVTLEGELRDTTEKVEAEVQDQEGIPPGQQHLVLGGEMAGGCPTLSDYTTEEESTLHWVLGQRGSTVEPSLSQLAQKYSCDEMICPKCHTRLHPHTHCQQPQEVVWPHLQPTPRRRLRKSPPQPWPARWPSA
ncbi:ubiquitin-60S ribosomal protein L40-like [Phyllostomus discolor]|uniref:Ubiquitin-ribosomal protein eL40 fusion protein n=1 Tax=Phyllostomus discolor TaxID=89673 RepID=A0A7E6CWC5_9CHIR|nr:ubiquitin-60S ribosomal protein L40-like [Phyllostomus discolor]